MNPSSSYLEAFGLSRPPFQQDDPAAYFISPLIKQRLDLLAHLAQFTQRLLVIKGEHGSGKSALLDQFLQRGEENWHACRITARIDLDDVNLWHQINHCFDLREEASLEQLHERLTDLSTTGQLALIVIDDAHLLPGESLTALLRNLTGDNGPLASLILAGEPAIEAIIAAPAIAGNLKEQPQILDLPPLADEQLAAYLTHRLQSVGFSGEPPFTDAQLKQLQQASGGVPGQINPLADSLLAELPHSATPRTTTGATTAPLPPVSSRRPLRTYLGAMLFITLVAPLLIFQQQINDFFAQGDRTTDTLPLALPAQPIHRGEPGQVAAEPPAIATTATLAEAVEPPTEEQPASTEATPSPAAPAPQKLPEPVAIPTPETTTAPPPVTEVPPAPATPPPTDAKEPIRTEAWLLSQRPTLFTLQLLGTEQEQKVVDYIREHQIEGRAAYFRTSNKGKTWFALLYGIYPSYEAARAAKNHLPSSLNRYTPWPRSLASVHAEIAKATPP